MRKKELLPFISNKELYRAAGVVLNIASKAVRESEINFYKNVIDPFSAIFDSFSQGITLREWLKQEKSRKIQKTLQNAMGDFHQNILGSMNSWKNLGKGEVVDISSTSKKIIAEVKNKYNTTKGNHKVAIYDDLKTKLASKYKGYTGYYVEVIPKGGKSYNKPFTPSDNRTHRRRASNSKIRIIDGKSFYALAAGNENALKMLYGVLPIVIGDILKNDHRSIIKGSEFLDLFDRAF